MIPSVKRFFVLSAFLCLCDAKFPSYVTPCSKDDPDLNACILNRVEIVRPHLKEGIPEFAFPSLDPLQVPKIELQNKDFSLTLLDVKLHHVNEFVVEDMKFDINKDRLYVKVTFPKVNVDCDYTVKGKILFLELDGSGPGHCDYTNAKAELDIHLERVEKKGKQYWKIGETKVNMDLGRPKVQFDNLFGDNKEMNEQTMNIVNDNIDDFLGDLGPAINDTVFHLLLSLFERLVNKLPIDELFP